MSNPLSVRRVQVQTLDELGQPVGPLTYGVMAADNYTCRYNDTFTSIQELNDKIAKLRCILLIIDDADILFPEANYRKIGTGNYYGKDWNIG